MRWLRRRRILAQEHARIDNVRRDAQRLLDELNTRRDGLPPKRISLPYLETAMRQVSDERAASVPARSDQR